MPNPTLTQERIRLVAIILIKLDLRMSECNRCHPLAMKAWILEAFGFEEASTVKLEG